MEANDKGHKACHAVKNSPRGISSEWGLASPSLPLQDAPNWQPWRLGPVTSHPSPGACALCCSAKSLPRRSGRLALPARNSSVTIISCPDLGRKVIFIGLYPRHSSVLVLLLALDQ